MLYSSWETIRKSFIFKLVCPVTPIPQFNGIIADNFYYNETLSTFHLCENRIVSNASSWCGAHIPILIYCVRLHEKCSPYAPTKCVTLTWRMGGMVQRQRLIMMIHLTFKHLFAKMFIKNRSGIPEINTNKSCPSSISPNKKSLLFAQKNTKISIFAYFLNFEFFSLENGQI